MFFITTVNLTVAPALQANNFFSPFPQVVTITVEKEGTAAVDVAFLTPDIIERANALVVTHQGVPRQTHESEDEGRDIVVGNVEALFGD